MALLFRAPLLQIDIRDEQQIKEHWLEILKALRLSSVALYERVHHKQPEELSIREKKSVFRYLLRGKYRATPFGLWAGVGAAKWTQPHLQNEESVKLKTLPIQISNKPDSAPEYWINPSLQAWGDGWKFWNFDLEKQQWRYSKSDDSPLIREMRTLSISGEPILQEDLFRSFPNLLKVEKDTIWQRLIEQQLLIRSNAIATEPPMGKKDYFILNKPGVSIQHRKKLETFLSEIGSLAVRQNNSYLEQLISRFEEEFDDRFVPLKMLWKLVPHLILESKTANDHLSIDETALYSFSLKDMHAVNLRKTARNLAPNQEIRHSQVLFRILENEQLLIDNLVFNRPFVYGGRFTHQPELFEYFRMCPGQPDDAIYADVILHEGVKAQHISSHKSITSVSLNCFCGSGHPGELDTATTYIGIHNGKFILTAPKSGKQVIPIFQHPLNPQFITHPICRILWEVAHQDFKRPIYYSEPQSANAEYLPQLEWGDIILQPRQWRIKWQDSFRKERDLMDHLAAKGVPQQILVGHQDQELALDLTYKEDLALLMEELRQKKPTHIQEWLWKGDKRLTSGRKTYYPQYVFGKVNKTIHDDLFTKERVNYISEFECKEWFSARIVLTADFQESILRDQLRLFFDKVEERCITPFYFLFYRLQSAEIRVRCRISSVQDKDSTLALLYTLQGGIADIDQIKLTSYYPELSKYSEAGMSISEEIFCQESKLISQINPKSWEEKIMLAVGIGKIYFNGEIDDGYWMEVLKNLSQGKTSHKPVKEYVERFERAIAKGWQVYYHALVRRHPWIDDKKNKGLLIGNHIHMLINRLFWEQAADVEPEIFSLLERYIRERKYGKQKLEKN